MRLSSSPGGLLRPGAPTTGARHRGAPDRRWRALAAAAVVAALALAAGGLGSPTRALAAGSGTVLLEDDFMSATTTATSYVVGGTNFTPCLTAGPSTSSTPVPGCGGAPDPAGSGALRLTANVNDQAGFLLYDKALPTKAGLDITFNEYQWGGTLADGITFFLTDGTYTLTRAGAFGGSLGYHHITNGAEGVAHALLGIGLDVFGNYTVETNDVATCGPGFTNSSLQPNTVAVRGPGDGRTGYCLLGPVAAAPELATRDGATRPQAVAVRIVVDPPSGASPLVKVYLDGRLVTSVPQPEELKETPTFKFGWGASTGGQNDFHEINFLQVESVVPIRSDLALTATATPVASGDTAVLSLTARTDAASGPVPAGDPVVLTADAPAGTELGAPSGAGWDCAASTALRLSCTRTSAAATDPGTTLPVVSAPLTRTAVGTSGFSTVTASVASVNDDTTLLADNDASAQVRWNPVASAVTAPATAAAASPVATTVDPSVVGSGPFVVEVVDTPDPAIGAVTVVDGRLVLRPAPGASGDLRATYRVTDADGGVSGAAAVSMRVAPVAPDGTLTTTAGSTASARLDAPRGTGAFTAELVARGAHLADARVVVDALGRPVVDVTPAAGWSGTDSVSYRVLDAAGVPSAPATVTVVVRPVAGAADADGVLDADGAARVVTQLPAGTGAGPLTYALVGDGDLGGARATLGPDGELTVTALTGRTGTYPVRYTVSDGAGTSDEAVVDVTIRPYLGAVPAVPATAVAPATSTAPVVHGTTPRTWWADEPAGTRVTVATDGAVTLDPRGASGTFDVPVRVRDASGGVSATRVVRFVVAPVAVAVDGEATASTTPVATRLVPAAPTGTGPFTLAVASGLAPGLGEVVVDGDALRITPAAGVSGTLAVTYAVTDATGLTGAPVRAELRVVPAAADAAARVPAGSTTDVRLPAPTGSGPFTWNVTSPAPTGAGQVDLLAGVATVRAAATSSGSFGVRYTVTDGQGLVSHEATLVVTADPTAPPVVTGGPARRPGAAGGPLTGPRPEPTGSGPFRFAIVTAPAPEQGTATIDPETGVVTFVPAPGFSGEVDVLYAATDGHGSTTPPAVARFDVAPVALPSDEPQPGSPERPARGRAGSPTVLRLPAPVGSGPFTYEIVDGPSPDQGTVTLDPRTGELTFVPARGFSGGVTLRYRVVDADGLGSEPAVLRIDVAPSGSGVPRTTATAGGRTTGQLSVPDGRGPFSWALLEGPTPEQGVLEIDAATGRYTFTAAAGFIGTVRFTYVVTGADGLRSEVLAAEVEVVPALAVTGAELGGLGALALVLLAGGAALVVGVRRRGRSRTV
jgi:hypothetical protein